MTASIGERVQALSAARRALLARRLADRTGVPVGADPAHRLVAYLTPEAGAHELGPEQLRDRLRQVLPDHLIPSAFHVLDAFPLLPNGKVDVVALHRERDDVAPADDEWVEPRNPTEQLLADLWCDTLQIDAISVNDDFFELGGDSILSITVVSRANQQGLSLSPNDLFNFPTIAKLAARSTAAEDTERRPVFMVHGGVPMATLLRSRLARDQRLYMLNAHRELTDLGRHATVDELARENLDELRSLQPHGPYYLAGYSMGAPIAIEMAQQLRNGGEQVALLFIIDPPRRPHDPPTQAPHGTSPPDAPPTSVAPASTGAVARHWKALSSLNAPGRARYLADETVQQIRHRVRQPLRAAMTKRVVNPSTTALVALLRRLGVTLPVSLRNRYVRIVYTDAWNRYPLAAYEGPMVLFGATRRAARDMQRWQAIARGPFLIEWFDGGHFDFTRNPEMRAQWAARFTELLEAHQSAPGSAGLVAPGADD